MKLQPHSITRERLQTSPAREPVLSYLRAVVPDLDAAQPGIPHTTYTRYRTFNMNGERATYELPYFRKRAMLTRAVAEFTMGEVHRRDIIHDLLWSICEESRWVVPAHEYMDPEVSEHSPAGREPEFIDLFAAETGAGLAETVHLLAEDLAPEVLARVRSEIDRRILQPYLARGRDHWWYRDDSNWNGVCNGAIGLTFLHLESDNQLLGRAIEQVRVGLDVYIARAFEPDGGSLEGIEYWNYGLMYYVAFAELLREHTGGDVDLLSGPRLKDIARYPLAVALDRGRFCNFGDAYEVCALQPGIVQRLSERTGVRELTSLLMPHDTGPIGAQGAAKLPIILRDLLWWDGRIQTLRPSALPDSYLPDCAIVRLTGRAAAGEVVVLAAKAGSNDGHHHHMDVGHFIVNAGGESLLCDPGRALYSRDYFSERRFENIFCSSYGHSVPRIGGRLQAPGPRFGGGPLAEGSIVARNLEGSRKTVVMDLHPVYGMAALRGFRRTLELDSERGEILLKDEFDFQRSARPIEEAFMTWSRVSISGASAHVIGRNSAITMEIVEPRGASFVAEDLSDVCRANRLDGNLTRIAAALPPGSDRFVLQMKVIGPNGDGESRQT